MTISVKPIFQSNYLCQLLIGFLPIILSPASIWAASSSTSTVRFEHTVKIARKIPHGHQGIPRAILSKRDNGSFYVPVFEGDKEIRFVDEEGNTLKVITIPRGLGKRLIVSPNNRYFLLYLVEIDEETGVGFEGTKNEIKVFDVTGKQLWVAQGVASEYFLSPTGDYALVSGGKRPKSPPQFISKNGYLNAEHIDPNAGKDWGNVSNLWPIEFSNDGNWVAIGLISNKPRVLLMNRHGQVVQTISIDKANAHLTTLTFSPNGKSLVIQGMLVEQDLSFIQIWDLIERKFSLKSVVNGANQFFFDFVKESNVLYGIGQLSGKLICIDIDGGKLNWEKDLGYIPGFRPCWIRNENNVLYLLRCPKRSESGGWLQSLDLSGGTLAQKFINNLPKNLDIPIHPQATFGRIGFLTKEDITIAEID